MMKKPFIFFGVLFFWSLLLAPAHGQTIHVVTEDYPPYNYEENGQLTGFSTEIVQAVVKKVGIKATFKLYPWSRAYRMALNNKNTLIYTITRKPKRENLFKWVGPIASRTIFLYKLKERNDIRINSISDAKKYIIGVMRDDGFTSSLTNEGFVIGENLAVVSNDKMNIQKLYRGRIDLMGNVEMYMAYETKKLGFDFGKLEKVYTFPDTNEYYMAFSLNTSDTIVIRFQEALDTLKQDGRYQRIADKYL